MSKRKRQAKKKLSGKGRLNDARRWLENRPGQKDLVASYSKRYGVSADVAEKELLTLGYYDEILIQRYEKAGIKWEYRVEPLSGEMLVVPEGTEDYELYELHYL